MSPFHSDFIEGTCMGVANVLKVENTQSTWTLTWEEFKLRLDKRFMPHHLVLQDGMEFLEFTQGDNGGSRGQWGFIGHLCPWLQSYVDYGPLKDKYAQKLIFLHGLKPWVQKIVYQRTNIPKMCQGLMKMMEWSSYMPQGWNLKCSHLEKSSHPKQWKEGSQQA